MQQPDAVRKCVINCAIGICLLSAVVGIHHTARAEQTIRPPVIEAPQTAAEEIVTGVCTFGDCPVATKEAPPETEPKTEQQTEPSTAPEPTPDTAPTAAQEPEAPVRQSGRTVTCYVTAYCGCESCSGEWGSMTATGVYARAGHTVAVDPGVIPYGTRVEINGTVYTAEDCGEAVNGYEIDVYFDSHWQTEAFATGFYEVTIY